ncbi:hypothetical protein BDQ17DRAFT_1425472 [Cyathus striatus]|nr:hypothetical protein BDQ17DRAFT_1425472 [Cyathus striatus]
MSNGADAKMDLNNAFQRLFRTTPTSSDIRYEFTISGPQNNAAWTAVVYIKDIQYGTGTSSSKTNAGHAAAKQALDALKRENPGKV